MKALIFALSILVRPLQKRVIFWAPLHDGWLSNAGASAGRSFCSLMSTTKSLNVHTEIHSPASPCPTSRPGGRGPWNACCSCLLVSMVFNMNVSNLDVPDCNTKHRQHLTAQINVPNTNCHIYHASHFTSACPDSFLLGAACSKSEKKSANAQTHSFTHRTQQMARKPLLLLLSVLIEYSLGLIKEP